MDGKKWLVLTPDHMGFAIVNPDQDVLVTLGYGQAALFPDINVAIRMTPTEARNIAQVLIHKAGEAESGLARA